MNRVVKEDIRTHPYYVVNRHVLTQVYKAMRLKISRLILHQIAKDTLHSLVFADEKKLDIKQTMNNQNGQFWSVSGSVRVDS